MSLLIYIPTYERYDLLMKQMAAILPYKDGAEVRLHISDNCSQDPRYQGLKSTDKIAVVRNGINIGANANIMNGFLAGQGYDYTWILSDDDILRPGIIPTLLDNLSADLIHICPEQDHTSQKDIKGVFLPLDNQLGGVSRLIYRSELIAPHIRTGYDYISCGFPHLAVLFAAIQERGKISVRYLHDEDYFESIASAPPSEAITYIPSLFGFLKLIDFIDDSQFKSWLANLWISDNAYTAIWAGKQFKREYKNLLAYLFMQSKQAYLRMCYKRMVYFFGSRVMNIYRRLK